MRGFRGSPNGESVLGSAKHGRFKSGLRLLCFLLFPTEWIAGARLRFFGSAEVIPPQSPDWPTPQRVRPNQSRPESSGLKSALHRFRLRRAAKSVATKSALRKARAVME